MMPSGRCDAAGRASRSRRPGPAASRLRALLALLVGAAICGGSPGSGAAAPAAPLSLAGVLKVALCSRHPCDPPPAGDPRWQSLTLGPDGSAARFDQHAGTAWISLQFDVPAQATFEQPALFIARPADAEEVFLNGVPIGGKGRIERRPAITVAGPRVLPLPAEALRPGPNQLRLYALFAGYNARVFTGPFRIGELDRLEAEAARLRNPIVAAEAAFLSLLCLAFIFYGFLVIKRVVRSDYLFLMAFLACYIQAFLMTSAFLHGDGVVGERHVHAQVVLESLLALITLGLVTDATRSRFGRVFWVLAAACVVFILLDLIFPPLITLTLFSLPRKVFFGLRGLYYLVLAVAALRRRREDALPVLAGVTVYVVGSRLDLFWGIPVRDYATGIFVLCMLFALTSRHARLRHRLEQVSARLLDAHEQERRRIARDIHDGVGQSLLALRLGLQQLGARAFKGVAVGREKFEELAAEVGDILEEVRRLSLDLRPSFVESMSLKELLSWYGSSFAASRGIALEVHTGSQKIPDPGQKIKDNLYRIYQEILTNVAKHANATSVEVSYYHTGRSLVLEVADNGCGIADGASDGGIGLETMRERAELIGGTCRVESAARRGTRVSVEVPVS